MNNEITTDEILKDEQLRKRLRAFSDDALLLSAKEIAKKERYVTSEAIEHIREIERRKLYNKNLSLKAFCIKELKYSETSAQRRIDAMFLTQGIPEAKEQIKSGELSLSVIVQAQAFFQQEKKIAGQKVSMEKKREILGKLAGKSSREAECELYKASSDPEAHLKFKEKTRAITETETQVQFIITKEQMELFNKLRGLLAHKYPDLGWAELFQKMGEIALEKLDPAREPKRSQKQRSASPTRISISKTKKQPTDPANKRYIPAALRRAVWQRDHGRCQICNSQHALEVDHIISWAAGGKTIFENLRLLCKNCNRRAAIQVFGVEKMNLARKNWKNA